MVNIDIWGKNTWIFFHTIAEKINPQYFDSEIKILLDMIKNICNNLPCPECSNDATSTLNKCNFDNIKTKDDFKLFVFYFHNNINKKLKKPLFKEEDLEKYKNCNLNTLLKNMYIIYNQPDKNSHMMANNFHKTNMIKSIIKYFNSNIYKFV